MRNEYRTVEDYTVVSTLYKEKLVEFVVDTKDIPLLEDIKWSARHDSKADCYYARGWYKGKYVDMHRYLLGLTDYAIVADHIDHNKQNNRRGNLRAVTRADNNWNKKGANKTNSTGMRGVSKQGQKYWVQIKKDGTWLVRESYYDLIEATMTAVACYNQINNNPVRRHIKWD